MGDYVCTTPLVSLTYIDVTVTGQRFEQVDGIEFISIYLSLRESFTDHIDYLAKSKKAQSRLYMLYKLCLFGIETLKIFTTASLKVCSPSRSLPSLVTCQ